MGGWVEILDTELSATRRDSLGELAMVVVIESYDSQESRSCGSSFPRESRTEGCAFGFFNGLSVSCVIARKVNQTRILGELADTHH